MSKFAIECPRCGSVNQASTFIFARKAIKCGSCGEEFNVKESRLVSKKCSHCGKIIVCDQAKADSMKCPSCGELVDMNLSPSVKYRMATISCPQCDCSIEIDNTMESYTCPICDAEIDVRKELAKQKILSEKGVDTILYKGDNSTFVWKFPIEEFAIGTKLIVHEAQEAIFLLNGEALDTFGPGGYTLEPESMPILKKLYLFLVGGQQRFNAEVYFINKTVQMGMKWGTDSRVRFIDPLTGIPLDIGASGELSLQVVDSRKLLDKLVGTADGLNNRTVLSDVTDGTLHKTLQSYFRAPLMTVVKSHLATVIKEQSISIFEIDSHLAKISEDLRSKVSAEFEDYGLSVTKFYITNIRLPEEDKRFQDIRALISDAYIGVKQEEVKRTIAQASQQRQILEEQTKAQLNVIKAQGEAEALRAKGLADAEVMRAKGYTQKDVIDADVKKTYAENLGALGNTSGSSVASDMVGMFAGMKMADGMFSQMGNMFGSQNTIPSKNETASVSTWKCECGETDNTKNFCMNCGRPRKTEAQVWTCPNCGENGNTKNFCANCGAKKP